MSLVKAKQLAEEAVAECNRMKCNDHRELKFICEVGARESLRKAIADARAAGFAEAIEAAAKAAADHHLPSKAWRKSIADSIRALAPAKEEP